MSWSLLGVKGLKKRQQQKEKTEEAIIASSSSPSSSTTIIVVLWDNYINVHSEKVVVFLFHIIP